MGNQLKWPTAFQLILPWRIDLKFPKKRFILLLTFLVVLSYIKLFGRLEGLSEKDSLLYRVGVKVDPKFLESSAPIAKMLPTEKLPNSLSLVEWFPPPAYQGNQASSVGFALGYYLKTYSENKKNPTPMPLYNLKQEELIEKGIVFSPSYIYNSTNDGKDLGGSLFQGLILLMSHGILPWKDQPYIESDFRSKPTHSTPTGLRYRIDSFYRIPIAELKQIQAYLSREYPIVVSILIYENYLDPQPPYIISQPIGKPLGLQAMVLVGYDNSKKAFLAMNSWGDSWGENGKIWISYSLFQKTAQVAYIIEDPPPLPRLEDLQTSYPSNIYASQGNYKDKIRITWDEVRGAIGYEIYRKRSTSNQYHLVGISLDTQFEDTGVQKDIAYQYKVASVFPDSTSGMSIEMAEGYATNKKEIPFPEKITGLKASRGNFPDRIFLQWNPIPGKNEYFIFKYNPYAGQFRLIQKTNLPQYMDRSARRNGEVEIYKISLSANLHTAQFSEAVMGFTSHRNAVLAPPQSITASKGDSIEKINIEWDPVPGADSYTIYRYTNESGWEKLTSTQSTLFEDTTPSIVSAYYSIVANSKLGIASKPSFPVLGIRSLAKERNLGPLPPMNVQIQIHSNSGLADIIWKPIANAKGYTIYKRTIGSNWEKVDTTNKPSFQLKLPDKEFVFISIASVGLDGMEGKKSTEYPMAYSTPVVDNLRTRSFGEESKLEKWKGIWTGMYWDGRASVIPVTLQIQSTELGKDFIQIRFNQKTIYKGDYIQETTILDPKGKFRLQLASEEISLTMETNDRSLLPTPAILSFLRE